MILTKLGNLTELLINTCEAGGSDADATTEPTYRIYTAGSATAVATGTSAKKDDSNTTGLYAISLTPDAPAYSEGVKYAVRVTATVAGKTQSRVIGYFMVLPEPIYDLLTTGIVENAYDIAQLLRGLLAMVIGNKERDDSSPGQVIVKLKSPDGSKTRAEAMVAADGSHIIVDSDLS